MNDKAKRRKKTPDQRAVERIVTAIRANSAELDLSRLKLSPYAAN